LSPLCSRTDAAGRGAETCDIERVRGKQRESDENSREALINEEKFKADGAVVSVPIRCDLQQRELSFEFVSFDDA
jgi:hypothetical protein